MAYLIQRISIVFCPKSTEDPSSVIARCRSREWSGVMDNPTHLLILEVVFSVPQVLHLLSVRPQPHEDIPIFLVSDGRVTDSDLVLFHDLCQP